MKPLPPIIIELLQRFAKKNPSFFKYIQYVSAAIAVFSFLPEITSFLGIDLPTWFDVFNVTLLKVGSITAIIMAQLPNETPIKKNDEGGENPVKPPKES